MGIESCYLFQINEKTSNHSAYWPLVNIEVLMPDNDIAYYVNQIVESLPD